MGMTVWSMHTSRHAQRCTPQMCVGWVGVCLRTCASPVPPHEYGQPRPCQVSEWYVAPTGWAAAWQPAHACAMHASGTRLWTPKPDIRLHTPGAPPQGLA